MPITAITVFPDMDIRRGRMVFCALSPRPRSASAPKGRCARAKPNCVYSTRPLSNGSSSARASWSSLIRNIHRAHPSLNGMLRPRLPKLCNCPSREIAPRCPRLRRSRPWRSEFTTNMIFSHPNGDWLTAQPGTCRRRSEEQEARTLQRVHPRPLFQQAAAFTFTASQSFRLINVKKS